MALLFCDGFDHYDFNDFYNKWTVGRNGSPTNFPTTGRFGSGWNGAERWSRKDFGTSYGTLIVGAAIRQTSPGAWGNEAIFGFYDAGTLQCDVRTNVSSNLILVTRNGTTLGSAPFVMSSLIWYYVELKITFHNTTGVAVVRINGIEVINLTNQDTQNTANATANQLRIGSHQDNAMNGAIDDLYVCDNSGGTNNDFLGDVRVEAIYPNGNGNSSVLVGSDGNSTDNYLLVDETPSNEDADYVQGSTVGDKDTYAYGNLTSTAGTVYGIQILPHARKTDAGSRSIATVARVSATEVDGPNRTLSTTYTYLPDIRETKPGGGAWSISDVNGAEFGVKVTV